MSTRTTFPPTGAATALACLFVFGASVLGRAEDAPTGIANDDPAVLAAEKEPLATKSLVLDVTDAASRAIAVGERGHVLVSESRQNDWRQVEGVPTRNTLTAVTAVGDEAWAVGHDGVILHSPDGGLTWQRQRLSLRTPDSDPDDPRVGAPLLDVLFLDAQHGFAIGAYSLLLETTDGGATWTERSIASGTGGAKPADDAAAADDGTAPADGGDAAGEGEESWTFDESDLELEEESDPHLNGIARTGDGSLFIVAERGSAFRSSDGGQTWQRIQLPYDGSMFGVIGYEGRHVLAYGLRGNVFESTDLGDNWKKIDTGVDLSIMGGTGWDGGGAALVGANGVVLTRSATSETMLKHSHPDGAVLASALALAPGGELVVAGETGIGTYTPN